MVEDQVDAVLCAYVALFADRQPERTTTYGDFETGYIVTPTLPEDLTSDAAWAADRRRRVEDPVGSAVREYAELQPELRLAADQFAQLVTAILDDAGINYLSVTGRAKSVASFAAKAARTVDGRPVFTDPSGEITDQIGVRVITYVHSDVQAVADLLGDQVVVHDDRDLGQETASEGRFGYASRHLLVGLDAARDGPPGYEPAGTPRARCRSARCCSTRGRSSSTTSATRAPSPTSTCPTSTAGSRWPPASSSSPTASSPRSATGSRQGWPDPAPRRTTTTRGSARASWRRSSPGSTPMPAGRAPTTTPGSPGCCSSWASPRWPSSASSLRPVDAEALTERMDYRYPPGAVRRLDDALLSAYGAAYVELRGNAHRVPALRARLAKLHDQ